MFVKTFWGSTELPNQTIYPLYPYDSVDFAVLFVYGDDFQREMHLFAGIPKTIQLIAIFILLFLSLAAISLRIIRWKLRLPRNDIVSTHIDCWIALIGGGNLEITHRLERWFFGILLCGAFFIVSVFSSDLLGSIVKVFNRKMSTFEDLRKINSPIYIRAEIEAYSQLIHEMLRLVLQIIAKNMM